MCALKKGYRSENITASKKAVLLLFFTLFFHLHKSGQSVGLIENREESLPGYILFAPLHSRTTYLIDRCGRQVHSWKSKYKPAQSAYLLPDGKLLRTGNDSNQAFINAGGIIEKINWSGEVIWSYKLSTPTISFHHDIYPMPNGNILAIVWQKKTSEEVKALGRKTDDLPKSIWMEKIVELKPKGKTEAKIVWEWKIWDHLIQDVDSKLPGYGKVEENPRLIDINYGTNTGEDWLHFNSVAYNAERDQIIISCRNLSEIFIIDHSTNTKQAASHSGGKYNKGGDLLYRWGNPAVFKRGGHESRALYSQHSAHWIDKGLNDEGKIMIFNNGTERSEIPYSSVEIIEPPTDTKGNYIVLTAKSNLPVKPVWSFRDSMPEIFYSKNVSNAQRLENGNTLICEGARGRFFEINKQGEKVWTYINPVTQTGIAEQGTMNLENQVFRCYFYSINYAAFKGKNLKPGEPIEMNPMTINCSMKTN